MPASYQQYQSWSPALQARYRRRYGKAPAGFSPFRTPTGPPAGSYDPAFDASLRASERGYGDLLAQNATNSLWSSQDYTQARDRENAAYNLNVGREGENYNVHTADLGRGYGRLGSQQTQQAGAQGIAGGALLQALAARHANQAHDQSSIDVAHQRTLADLGTAHTNALADMLTGYSRGQLQQGTQQAIAGRELGFSQQDVGAEKLFAATQAGWIPPQKPASESTIGNVTFRRLGGGRYLLPSGRKVRRAGLRRLY